MNRPIGSLVNDGHWIKGRDRLGRPVGWYDPESDETRERPAIGLAVSSGGGTYSQR
ncbi:hypothetical protein LQ954_11070 [Sphingomonas sp. IC-11]|uniref:hypothetical protein n=1 Tax=Sphingomonas sp. IC-11 TaxID=2898528 RepID=UPI001E55A584|nr:hypothetical protein [Sphingomonas sp. IC-11]MCD2316689.1 hypothetical protein [Sphingomonas sp. IC-11]